MAVSKTPGTPSGPAKEYRIPGGELDREVSGRQLRTLGRIAADATWSPGSARGLPYRRLLKFHPFGHGHDIRTSLAWGRTERDACLHTCQGDPPVPTSPDCGWVIPRSPSIGGGRYSIDETGSFSGDRL